MRRSMGWLSEYSIRREGATLLMVLLLGGSGGVQAQTDGSSSDMASPENSDDSSVTAEDSPQVEAAEGENLQNAPTPKKPGARLGNRLRATDNPDYDVSDAQWQEEYRSLNKLILRFEQGVEEFDTDVSAALEQKREEELQRHQATYDVLLDKLREEVSVRRAEAIARYEQFLQRYPDSAQTAIAMVRLAELYYEEDQLQFFADDSEYQELFDAYSKKEIASLPDEPKLDYRRTLDLYEQVLARFPDYNNVDAVHYVRGFIYNQPGATASNPEKAKDAFLALITDYPDSVYVFQAYLLIGDYYFDQNELSESISYYLKALDFKDKPWDLALYKLAWARYRSQSYDQAIERFIELLDYSDDLEARTGKESNQRPESVQYLAISFADYSAFSEESVFTFDDAAAYFEKIGGRPYQLEVLKKLAEVYQQLARFDDAVYAYNRLQELYPNNPDNPRFQREVFNIHLGLPYGADTDAAIEAQKNLVARYSGDSAWYGAMNESLNKKAVTYSETLVQEALKDIAFHYHEQAVNPETTHSERARFYDEAGEYYRLYLSRYPYTEDAFELQYYYAECLYNTGRMEDAAKEYKRVLTYTNPKYHSPAAQSIIFALGDLIQDQNLQAGLVIPFEGDPSVDGAGLPKAVDIDPLVQEYIESVDTYVRIEREAEDTPRFMFIAARAFFFHSQFDEARRRFEELITLYPADESSVQAALLTVDSYDRQNDWNSVVTAVDALSSMELGSDPTNWRNQRDTLLELKANAVFRNALTLFDVDENQELEVIAQQKSGAGEAFLDYADKFPDADNRAGALANAALAFEQAGNTDQAIDVRKRLIREHPESDFIEASYFYIASNYERAFDFTQAIQYHEEMASKFPDSPNAPISLFNSAFLKLGMREYSDAAKGFETYVRLYPDRGDTESVLFMAAETWEKAEEWAQAVRVYRDYVRNFPSTNGDRVVLAYFRTIQDLDRLGRTREAIDSERKLTALYTSLVENSLLSLRGLNLYAAIRFREVERQYAAFEEISLQGSERQLGRQLERKDKAQEELTRLATGVGKLGDQEYRLASLYYVARTYQAYAKSAEGLPIPAGLDEFEQEIYVEEVRERFVYPNEETAISLYEAILQQSEDLKLSNDWTDGARDQLNVLQPDAYPIRKPERTKNLPADKDFAAPMVQPDNSASQAQL